MPNNTYDHDRQTVREVSRLLRIQERAVDQLDGVRQELESPGTRELLRKLRNRTGSALPDRVREVVSSVEEAIRALKVSDSHARAEYHRGTTDFAIEGLPNLPTPLARFLAERADLPGFTYTVIQDEVRGWVIRWKEYTGQGTVRGSGQFYERPYAWLDE